MEDAKAFSPDGMAAIPDVARVMVCTFIISLATEASWDSVRGTSRLRLGALGTASEWQCAKARAHVWRTRALLSCKAPN